MAAGELGQHRRRRRHGADGKSGWINNAADKRVFDSCASLADAIVVGAGTARAEGYRPAAKPIVLVSRSGGVPRKLRDAPRRSAVLMATAAGEHRRTGTLGDDHVLVLGEAASISPRSSRSWPGAGLTNLLCEGGPHLLPPARRRRGRRALRHDGVLRLVGGAYRRITAGPPVDTLRPMLLLETAAH